MLAVTPLPILENTSTPFHGRLLPSHMTMAENIDQAAQIVRNDLNINGVFCPAGALYSPAAADILLKKLAETPERTQINLGGRGTVSEVLDRIHNGLQDLFQDNIPEAVADWYRAIQGAARRLFPDDPSRTVFIQIKVSCEQTMQAAHIDPVELAWTVGHGPKTVCYDNTAWAPIPGEVFSKTTSTSGAVVPGSFQHIPEDGEAIAFRGRNADSRSCPEGLIHSAPETAKPRVLLAMALYNNPEPPVS